MSKIFTGFFFRSSLTNRSNYRLKILPMGFIK